MYVFKILFILIVVNYRMIAKDSNAISVHAMNNNIPTHCQLAILKWHK